MFQVQLNEDQRRVFSSAETALEYLENGYEVTETTDNSKLTRQQLELLVKYGLTSQGGYTLQSHTEKVEVGDGI